MNIAILLPTRHRPRMALSVLSALDHLASGKNTIRYQVRVDEDDTQSRVMLDGIQSDIEGINVVCKPRPVTLGHATNEAAQGVHADAYAMLGDDVFPLCQHWDEGIRILIGEHDIPAFCWTEVSNPNNHTYPVLSSKWVEAVGTITSGHFPFWFDDTWLAEVYELSFGQPMPIVADMRVGGKRGKTQGLRDLSFWFEFFDATRSERIEWSGRIAKAFGVERDPGALCDIIARHHQRTVEQLGRCAEYEEKFGTTQPPSDQYMNVKMLANQWLIDNRKAP